MRRLSSIAGLALFTTLAASLPAQAQTPRQQVRVAVSTATPHNTPLWVAKDKKIFDKYGLDVQLIFVGGGALVAQMLAAGEIQIAAGAPAALVSLIAGGEKIVMFLGLSNTSPFTLVTQPTIKQAADLKGKKLGLNAKRDNIAILQTGLDPERMAALEAKGLDAAMLQRLPTKIMAAKGYTLLLNLNQAKIPYQNTVLAAKRDYARSKAAENFTRAVIEGYGYVFNKDNKQAVKEVIARNLRLAKVEDAEEFYLGAQEELDRKPYPTLEGTKTVLKYVTEQNPKAASVKAEEMIDSAVLKTLESEGFFDKVYGK